MMFLYLLFSLSLFEYNGNREETPTCRLQASQGGRKTPFTDQGQFNDRHVYCDLSFDRRYFMLLLFFDVILQACIILSFSDCISLCLVL